MMEQTLREWIKVSDHIIGLGKKEFLDLFHCLNIIIKFLHSMFCFIVTDLSYEDQ